MSKRQDRAVLSLAKHRVRFGRDLSPLYHPKMALSPAADRPGRAAATGRRATGETMPASIYWRRQAKLQPARESSRSLFLPPQNV